MTADPLCSSRHGHTQPREEMDPADKNMRDTGYYQPCNDALLH